MPIWYPSFVVNMQIRFDESFNVTEDDSPAATSVTDQESNSGFLTFGPPAVRPLVLAGAQDKLTQVAGRIPRSGTVELNGLRQAHTFSLMFDYRDLPIDPRLIRDIRIEIFLGVVQPAAFARGMGGGVANGNRASVIDTSLSSTNKTNLLLVGMVDEMEADFGGKGSMIHMTGRDLRGILIDAKADPRIFTSLNLSKPIDDVVLQIVSRLPFGKLINVYAQPQEWPNGVVPSPATVDGVTRVRLGADGTKNPMSTPQGEGDKIGFWDLITKYCLLVGAVPFFVGKDIRIRPTNSLYSQIAWDGTAPTPFAGGQARTVKMDGKSEKIRIRRFVYGRDLSSVKFSRKYRGQKAPVIEVVSIDTSSSSRGLQKMVIARWPDNTGAAPKTNKYIARAAKTSVAPSGKDSQSEVLRFSIPGIKSKAALQEIAKNLYQEIGRNEFGGNAETKDFASFNTDDGTDPDMLTLFPGDACQFVVDKRVLSSRNPLVSELTTQSRESFGQAVQNLAKRTGDENLARVLVATARNSVVELQDTFRTKNVKYDLAEGGAVGISWDFENYLEVRSDAVNPKLTQTTKKPTGRSTPQ